MTPNLEHSRYDLYLELETREWGMGNGEWLQQTLLPAIDQALAEVNIEYAEKRRSKRLHSLCLHLMRPGWCQAELLREAAKGKRDVQYKWKMLCHQRHLEDGEAIVATIEGNDDAR
jgi:hypothetical protein